MYVSLYIYLTLLSYNYYQLFYVYLSGNNNYHSSVHNYCTIHAGSLSFVIMTVDFVPGNHTLILTITGALGLTDSATIFFTTPPRLVVSCNVISNHLICHSTNKIVSQTCSFDGQTSFTCSSSFSIAEIGLDAGPHNVSVSISDEFGQSTDVEVDFIITEGLNLQCETQRNLFLLEINCQSIGETGSVSITCSYDGAPPENCEEHRTYYINVLYYIAF